jgi:hypothetical protein
VQLLQLVLLVLQQQLHCLLVVGMVRVAGDSSYCFAHTCCRSCSSRRQ